MVAPFASCRPAHLRFSLPHLCFNCGASARRRTCTTCTATTTSSRHRLHLPPTTIACLQHKRHQVACASVRPTLPHRATGTPQQWPRPQTRCRLQLLLQAHRKPRPSPRPQLPAALTIQPAALTISAPVLPASRPTTLWGKIPRRRPWPLSRTRALSLRPSSR